MVILSPVLPIISLILLDISNVVLSVKVRSRIFFGGTFSFRIKWFTRLINVVVFPVPAPARIINGAGLCKMASF